jgi:hypothetical protein
VAKMSGQTFTLVLLTVAGITVFCGVTQIILAMLWEHPTELQQTTFEAMQSAWHMGVGSIFTLLAVR